MPERLLHDPLYRWLIRLLPLGVAVTIALLALGTWQVTASIRHNQRINQHLAAQTHRLDHAVRLLCDRGYIEDAVIQFLRSQHLGNRPAILLVLHAEMIAQLTDRDSPCVSP